MAAITYLLRAEWRTRWRAWLGLALLVGLAAGATIALLAGARRTDSAYRRFLAAQRASDVSVIDYPEDGTAVFDFSEIARLPLVAETATAGYEYDTLDTPSLAPADGRLGGVVNKVKLLKGRMPRPDHAEELAIGFQVARANKLHVGSRIVSQSGPQPGTPAFDALQPIEKHYERLFNRAVPHGFVVVGIEAAPGEFPPDSGTPCCIYHSTAWARLGFDRDHKLLAVRLVHGAADVPAFRRALEARSKGKPLEIQIQQEHAAAVQRSFHLQAVALGLVGAIGLLVAALVLAQLLGRIAWLESPDYPTLTAIGTTRRARFALGVGRAALIGAMSTLVAVPFAIALSPLFPLGLARTAEPHPGVALGGWVLAVGGLVVLPLVVALAALPAWLAAGVDTSVSRTARVSGRRVQVPASAPLPAQAGARMALQRGKGAGAVPVWSSLGAVALGIGTLVASIGFLASLDHMLSTPRLYGIPWDLELTTYDNPKVPRSAARLVPLATRRRDVAGVAVGDVGFPTTLDGRDVGLLAIDPVEGDALPPLLAGRAPVASDEIALGGTTLRALHVSVGDVVTAQTPKGRRALRVVGRAVLPAGSETLRLGEGGYMTSEGALALFGLPK